MRRAPDSRLVAAFRFFLAHAGCIVGERARCALALARAEQWARDNGVTVDWREDDYADWSFVETWTPKEQKRWHESEHYAEMAIARKACECCKTLNVAASLGGIIDADNDYRRVIEAELVAEVMCAEGAE
jgi:hypothetical protein